MNRLFLTAFGLALGVGASAQSISSFNVAALTGISVNRVGNQITLNVGAAPTILWNSNTYNVTEVFGVWALDDDDDMGATGVNQNGWNWDTNFSGVGGIAGWKTNPNSGILNSSLVFNYTTLTGTVEDFGYHIRVDGNFPGGGNTAYFRNVPEPGTMAVLGLGGLALLRRRRARS
ncbi:MAG TPA: PEP-CTERM sorting domain-containing protein [Fimbriimonadaceae bacterium]|nr:PEP-CTERM sorting domain-containing protein [Fimbriimonadaceae bacterium]HRJ96423.1 PEP-CTERM sorting domain-containing protein [Fimbriimonadaceae bacterium]